ncbi:ATP-binding protein [Streptomyces sp. NPDC001340]
MGTVSLHDPWIFALRLSQDPRAAQVARATVRAALCGHGRQEALDVVELLTSELVTNAYRHTKGPASLRLTTLADGRLRVGVWDSRIPAPFGDPPWDRTPLALAEAESGRGLHLVRPTGPRCRNDAVVRGGRAVSREGAEGHCMMAFEHVLQNQRRSLVRGDTARLAWINFGAPSAVRGSRLI